MLLRGQLSPTARGITVPDVCGALVRELLVLCLSLTCASWTPCSSATQVGHQLALIGDEFHRTYYGKSEDTLLHLTHG